MNWNILWDFFLYKKQLLFDSTCCRTKSELETGLRFPVSWNRNQRQQWESFFLVVHGFHDLRHKQYTNFCGHHAQGFNTNFCFKGFFLFLAPPFDIFTWLYSSPNSVFAGLTSALLCHNRFPTVEKCSQTAMHSTLCTPVSLPFRDRLVPFSS